MPADGGVVHAHVAGGFDGFHHIDAGVGGAVKPEGFHRTGVAVQNCVKMRVVPVQDAQAALAEQQAFAVEVFFEALVLPRTDVVAGDVQEDADVERDPGGAVQHQPLRRHFHHRVFAPFVHHPAEQLLQLVRFGRGVDRFDRLRADERADAADQAGFVPRFFQNCFQQVGGGGFAFGAGDADGFQLPGRVAEEIGGHLRQRDARVRHLHHRDVGGGIHRVLHNQCSRALFGGLRSEGVTVELGAADAHERAARRQLAGVVGDVSQFGIGRLLQKPVIQPGEHFG